MRAAVLLLALVACGDNTRGTVKDDAAVSDAAPDGALKACLDQPTALARPPSSGQLPCELLPPGFGQ